MTSNTSFMLTNPKRVCTVQSLPEIQLLIDNLHSGFVCCWLFFLSFLLFCLFCLYLLCQEVVCLKNKVTDKTTTSISKPLQVSPGQHHSSRPVPCCSPRCLQSTLHTSTYELVATPEPAGFSGLRNPTYLCLHCWPPAQPLSVPHAPALRSLWLRGGPPVALHACPSTHTRSHFRRWLCSVPLPAALAIAFIVCPALLPPPHNNYHLTEYVLLFFLSSVSRIPRWSSPASCSQGWHYRRTLPGVFVCVLGRHSVTGTLSKAHAPFLK